MSDTDTSPESLRKFLESDDPSLVLKGLSIAWDLGVEEELQEELLPLVVAHALVNDEAAIRRRADRVFATQSLSETMTMIRWGLLENAIRVGNLDYLDDMDDMDWALDLGEDAVNFLIEVLTASASLSPERGHDLRCVIASWHYCPVALLELLAKDTDRRVRGGVAANPYCVVPLLKVLAKDKNRHVRQGVAQNENSSAELLEELAKDDVRDVRYTVARHPNCPVPVLALLAKDNDEVFRGAVASNPNCPSSLLTLLAKDGVAGIRRSAFENPNFTSPFAAKPDHVGHIRLP